MAGRTTILIAHRRSTLELADRVAVLDDGRLVDVGTADELEARCPLYRLLLSGPGDDAEGVDAGELTWPGHPADTMVDGVTPALWDPALAPPRPRSRRSTGVGSADVTAAVMVAASRRAATSVAVAMSDAMASMPPHRNCSRRSPRSPRRLTYPTSTTRRPARPIANFTLKKLIRPLLKPLLVAFVLVALDALATLALPVLIRTGVDKASTRTRTT